MSYAQIPPNKHDPRIYNDFTTPEIDMYIDS